MHMNDGDLNSICRAVNTNISWVAARLIALAAMAAGISNAYNVRIQLLNTVGALIMPVRAASELKISSIINMYIALAIDEEKSTIIEQASI